MRRVLGGGGVLDEGANNVELFRKSILIVNRVVVASRTVPYLGRIVLNNLMYRYNSSPPGDVEQPAPNL